MSIVKKSFIMQVENEMKQFYSALKQETIIIWGTGAYGKMLLKELIAFGMRSNIAAFCDNYPEKIADGVIDSIPIWSPLECIEKLPNATYLIASSSWEEILEHAPKTVKEHVILPDEFLRSLEYQLTFIFSNREKDLIAYAGYWFELYEQLQTEGKLQKYVDETMQMLEDDISKEIIRKRMDFFLTGEINYIREIPYSSKMYFCKDYYPFGGKETLICELPRQLTLVEF